MGHRFIGQKSLADQVVGRVTAPCQKLQKMHDAVDWKPIQEAISGLYASPFGRASYPPLAMFKILILQQWYRLSDEQMEEALLDRIGPAFRNVRNAKRKQDNPLSALG